MYTEDNIEYVRGRLVETIVRDKVGEPFYVTEIRNNDGRFKVKGFQILNPHIDKAIPFKELNLEPVPLGYVNSDEFDAVYIERKPMRNDWRQGLRARNVRVTGGADFEELHYKDIRNTVLNIFPSFSHASKCKNITAFCRSFAVNLVGIYYKGELVGTMGEGLNKDKLHLREFFEEMISENP
jgi:hypothetical protein